MSATDLRDILRVIAREPYLLECPRCLDPVTSGDEVVWEGHSLCASCALTAATVILTHVLDAYVPDPDERSIERAVEVMRLCLARVRGRVRP